MSPMKYARICLFVGLSAPLAGCGEDQVELRRGIVDEAALTGGVVVSVSGNVGSVSVPFDVKVPSVTDDDFQDVMDGAVWLVVTSVSSGASVDIGAGTPLSAIGGTPSAAGEFTWHLNAGRDEATLKFFNATPKGLTLSRGTPYEAQFSVMPNDYVEEVKAISFPVTVQ